MSVRVDDRPATTRAAGQLAASALRSTVATALLQALRGHQALAQKRYADASAAFAAGMVDVPARERMLIPALQQQVDRYAFAEALRALGRNEASEAWRASLRDGPAVWNASYLARSRN